jgi:hypothetical protein
MIKDSENLRMEEKKIFEKHWQLAKDEQRQKYLDLIKKYQESEWTYKEKCTLLQLCNLESETFKSFENIIEKIETKGKKLGGEYTRQSLPKAEYRALLGSALCVFNANNSFIIENILSHDIKGDNSWHKLMDKSSGRLADPIQETITRVSNDEIAKLFQELIAKRNRIIHSFQITFSNNGEDIQMLATKDRSGKQFHITEEYLLRFIKDNEKLCLLLDSLRNEI